MAGQRARLNQFSSLLFSKPRPVPSPILCLTYEQVSKRGISTHSLQRAARQIVTALWPLSARLTCEPIGRRVGGLSGRLPPPGIAVWRHEGGFADISGTGRVNHSQSRPERAAADRRHSSRSPRIRARGRSAMSRVMGYGGESVRKPAANGNARRGHCVCCPWSDGRTCDWRSGGAVWRSKSVILAQRGSEIVESTFNALIETLCKRLSLTYENELILSTF
jgi:hypothetical protein